MIKQITLYEWLQNTHLSSGCCLDIVIMNELGSGYHQLETNEPALKNSDYMFAKRFSEVTYKELQPYLELIYESSQVYSVTSDLIIVEVRVKAKEKDNNRSVL